MEPQDRFEDIVKRDLDVRASNEVYARMRDIVLDAHGPSQTNTSATAPTVAGRSIMKSPITKTAMAAAAILTVGVGSIGILHHGGQAAYGFEQTVKAMQGKQSFHIKVYRESPTEQRDEFWAQFGENSELLRYRQEESDGPIVTVWENDIRTRHYPRPVSIRLITRIGNTEDELEEFDPELAVQRACEQVAAGTAIAEVHEPTMDERCITIIVTRTDGWSRRVLFVDPNTNLVTRVDTYWRTIDDEAKMRRRRPGEEWVYDSGIEVLGYNEPIDPNRFTLNPPGAITLDQVSEEVGMAQDEMKDEEVAMAVVREALSAWATGDYVKAGKLFGGAPPEFLADFYVHLRPVGPASIGQPRLVQYRKPWFEVPCRYEVEGHNGIETIGRSLHVLAVDGQPGRWYVSIERTP